MVTKSTIGAGKLVAKGTIGTGKLVAKGTIGTGKVVAKGTMNLGKSVLTVISDSPDKRSTQQLQGSEDIRASSLDDPLQVQSRNAAAPETMGYDAGNAKISSFLFIAVSVVLNVFCFLSRRYRRHGRWKSSYS